MKLVALTIIFPLGYQTEFIDQPIWYVIAQGMAFPKTEISNMEIAPHGDTLLGSGK